MRILHTSDWHLGRQLHNVSLLNDQRHILTQITDIVSEYDVDVVLVCGDIYDRSVPSSEAVALLDEVVNRINVELKIPLIMIAGNHDGVERLSFAARQLAYSKIYISGPLARDLAPVTLKDKYGEVDYYLLPYADPATVRSVYDIDVHNHDDAMQFVINKIKQTVEKSGKDRRSVILSHCFVDGGEGSDSERPLSIGGADKVNPEYFISFDYAALGHLHGPQYKTAEHIRYSGSPLKYSFSEHQHKKSVTLVDMDANGSCQIEKVALNPLHDMRVIEGELDDVLVAGKTDPNKEDYLLIRLLDKHAILDVMGKLREVYPNVLHVERPSLATGGAGKTSDRSKLEKGGMPMFQDFYQQMTDAPLNEEEQRLIAGLLQDIYKGEGS